MKIKKIIKKFTPPFLLKVYSRLKEKMVLPEKSYDDYAKLSPDKYESEIRKWFHKKFGKALTRENVQTFNEKIQWLRCYDSTLMKTRFADKYLCREYVKERIGEQYLIPLLGVYDSFDEINFSNFPERFVLKANHGCSFNIIVTDKKQFDQTIAREKFNKWLKTNYAFYFLELHYKNIIPKIIVEEFLENSNGNLIDYKIHCFNGEPKYIQVIGGRATPPVHEAFLDVNWIMQPFTYTYSQYDQAPPKPEKLKELLDLARLLARDFTYVRVDLYVLNDGYIRFGEMTFTPAGGMDSWNPPEWDLKLGQLISLPDRKTIFSR